jgi:hypothetical protein
VTQARGGRRVLRFLDRVVLFDRLRGLHRVSFFLLYPSFPA